MYIGFCGIENLIEIGQIIVSNSGMIEVFGVIQYTSRNLNTPCDHDIVLVSSHSTR